MTKRRLKALTDPAPARKDSAPGARLRKQSFRDRLASYRSHHRQVGMDSFKRMLRRPATTLMTWLVIAIALALPTGLHVGLNNVNALSGGWEGAARLSLFLKKGLADGDAQALAGQLSSVEGVAKVDYISPEVALDEFRQASGFGKVLDELDGNPLPGLLVVTPLHTHSSAEAVVALEAQFKSLPEVDLIKLDMEWIQRLNSITELLARMTLALAAMLGLGVLLIVGNTIKLAIEGRRDEILVVKLVGGTNAFVRRPFLYTGLWYGLGGGVVAWILVQAGLIWLSGPVSRLSALYGSEFSLLGLGFIDSLLLWLFGALLGLGGAWLVVGRELRAIEPR